MDVIRNVAGTLAVESKGLKDLKLSSEGDLDTWEVVSEGDSCATSDWDSPTSSPPDSPRGPAGTALPHQDTQRSACLANSHRSEVLIAADKSAAAGDGKLEPSTPKTAALVVTPGEAAKPASPEPIAAPPLAAAPEGPKPDFDLGKDYYRAELDSVHELAKERTFRVTLKPACTSAKPLQMFIGDAEGKALAMALSGWKWHQQGCRRPLTYDFMHSMVSALGRQLAYVRICASDRGVFFARAHFQAVSGVMPAVGDATLAGVDSRPSDALNLALRAGAPIYVHRQLVKPTV